MVILRIVLEDFRLLLVVEIANQVVRPKFFPPYLAIYKPTIVLAMIVSYRWVAYICFASSTLNLRARRNRSCQGLEMLVAVMVSVLGDSPCTMYLIGLYSLLVLAVSVIERLEHLALVWCDLDARFVRWGL